MLGGSPRIALFMKKIVSTPVFNSRGTLIALAASLSTLGILSSCQEEQEEQEETSDATPAPAATPTTPEKPSVLTPEQAQAELNAYLNNEVKDLVISSASSPAVRDVASVLLEKLEAYYAAMNEQPMSIEKLELAVDIAEFQRQFAAWDRSYASFERALKDWESLEMKQKTLVPVQRLKSSIYNGLAATLLYRPASDAAATAERNEKSLNYFKEQLDSDLSIFNNVGPKEGDPIPATEWGDEVNRATSDLISSYRCVGDGLLFNNNVEDARIAYSEGVKIAQRVQKLSEAPSMQLIKILAALGDLESKEGNDAEALKSWSTAAQIAIQLNKNSSNSRTKLETKQITDRLTPVIRKLQAAQAQPAAN